MSQSAVGWWAEMTAGYDPDLIPNLPSEHYIEPGFFSKERDLLFGHSWQLLGCAARLGAPGDYFATDIAGARVAIVRDNAGELRGFRNVCRHRGASLLTEGYGNTRQIRCPYHNWVYELSGELRRAPDFLPTGELNATGLALHEITVSEWRGLVFAALAPTQPLTTQLGATIDELRDEPMESATLVATERLEFNANWKIYVDNFVEGYHIPGIHPAFFRAIDFTRFQTTAHDGLVRMSAPTASELFYRGRWLWMWPNWTLSLYPGGFNTSRINPVSERRTELLYHFYFQDASAAARDEQLATVAGNMAVIREDFAICEEIHGNFEAGSYTPGPLSPKHETGVAYFQKRLMQTVTGR